MFIYIFECQNGGQVLKPFWLLMAGGIVITGAAATELFFLPDLGDAPFQKKTQDTNFIPLNSTDFKWN